MSNPKRNKRFLKALSEELQSMSDADALEGENAESLVKLGHALLTSAREEAHALDDFQRGLQARLAHLIGEASQWARGSGAHPPGLAKALDEAFEYVTAETERLRGLIRAHSETCNHSFVTPDGGSWKAVALGECPWCEIERLRSLIREHNAECEELCAERTSFTASNRGDGHERK